jgi:hypothetical protein
VEPFEPGVLEPYLEGTEPVVRAPGEAGATKVDVHDLFSE